MFLPFRGKVGHSYYFAFFLCEKMLIRSSLSCFMNEIFLDIVHLEPLEKTPSSQSMLCFVLVSTIFSLCCSSLASRLSSSIAVANISISINVTTVAQSASAQHHNI